MPGAAAYRKGRAGEYLCQAHLNGLGYYVTRAYASKGPWDLLALRAGDWPLMIQVKVGERAYLAPAERNRLWHLALKSGAQAVVAMVPHPYSRDLESVGYFRMSDKDTFAPYEPTP